MFELIPGFANFLIWERQSKDTIDFKKVYVDMAGDLLAGLLLSQIVFWYLPTKDGGNKLRIQREGEYWIAKRREDWWDEVRLAPREVDKSLEKLRAAGIIETRVWKFGGMPTTHVRILPQGFMDVLNAVTKDGRKRARQKFQRDGRRGKKAVDEAQSLIDEAQNALLQMCDNDGFPTSENPLLQMCDNQVITNVGIGNHTSESSLTETPSETLKEDSQTDFASLLSGGEKPRPVDAANRILAASDSPFARALRKKRGKPDE